MKYPPGLFYVDVWLSVGETEGTAPVKAIVDTGASRFGSVSTLKDLGCSQCCTFPKRVLPPPFGTCTPYDQALQAIKKLGGDYAISR